MTVNAPGGRAPRRALVLGATLLATLAGGGLSALARLETWREETASAFAKGRRERVVVADTGRVRLGLALKPVNGLETTRVWDLARDRQDAVYAATGDEGKVYRRGAKDDASWTVAYDAADTQVLSLAVGPEGHVFAGTGPSGQVVDVTDPKHPASRPDPGVQYVWDLAADAKGNLYAATGPNGQLWKRAADGAWSLVYDSKHPHLLSAAVGPDGSVYAGSDGEGLVYKVAPGGKVSVLYDATQTEVRCLLVGKDGSVYAGTASESGGGPGRTPAVFGNAVTALEGRGPGAVRAAAPAQDPPTPPEAPKKGESRPPRGGSSAAGGSASPKPPTPGDNAVYRIDADGVAREMFRAKAMVFALAVHNDRLLVGTGPEGQLYEVRDEGHESAPVAKLDHGQILAMLPESGGGLLLAAGDPGAVVRVEPGYVASGLLVSDVRDTKLISRFGAVSWRAETPPGTAVAVQVRTGNVAEPDATWSDWSAEQTDPENAQAQAPPGRFVQYRVRFSTKDPAVTPQLSAVSVRYQSANLPPEIAKIDVPDVSALDGTTRQTRLTFRWDVNDPNEDDLEFNLALRKDGWPDWVKLNEAPITEKTFAWDTTSVPAGVYRVRLSASDRPSNNAEAALSREKASEAFVVDHEVPAVSIKTAPRKATVSLKDRLTRIAKASYAVDGGEWQPVFADDGLFDTPAETVTIPLPDLKPGAHVLVVRATDAAGNVGTGDALVEVR